LNLQGWERGQQKNAPNAKLSDTHLSICGIYNEKTGQKMPAGAMLG